MSDKELIERAAIEMGQREMEGTQVEWSDDYPDTEGENYSDFPQEYRLFDGEDRDVNPF